MATGRQMLEAVWDALKATPESREFRLSIFDPYDLLKLTTADLVDFGVDERRAEEIDRDLLNGNLEKLGECLGVRLIKDKHQRNLIPLEGIRRTHGVWANDTPSDPNTVVR